MVHLQGALEQTSSSGSDANLLGWTGHGGVPSAYAPPGRTVYTIAHTLGGTYADLAIDSNGEIWLIPSPSTNPGFVSLEGINYSVGSASGGPVSQIQLASNWYSYTPQYNYGASAASWWEDSNQTVHLEGGVQELTKTSGWAQLIGWIPTSAAPWQGTVYTIVHTLGGTYADLSINDNGQIWLLPSPNTNSGFVSLEGVTFSRLGAGGFHPIGAVSGWAPETCCAAAPLGWYADPDGVVHLKGGLTQAGTTSSSPGVTWVNTAIARLDPAAAPASYVYTIVHTFAGTYADLAISPDGTITLLGTQMGGSLLTQPYYVSLDGVTYQR